MTRRTRRSSQSSVSTRKSGGNGGNGGERSPALVNDEIEFPPICAPSSARRTSTTWGKAIKAKTSPPTAPTVEKKAELITTTAPPTLTTATPATKNSIAATSPITLTATATTDSIAATSPITLTATATTDSVSIVVPRRPSFSMANEDFPSLGGCAVRKKPVATSFAWRVGAQVRSKYKIPVTTAKQQEDEVPAAKTEHVASATVEKLTQAHDATPANPVVQEGDAHAEEAPKDIIDTHVLPVTPKDCIAKDVLPVTPKDSIAKDVLPVTPKDSIATDVLSVTEVPQFKLVPTLDEFPSLSTVATAAVPKRRRSSILKAWTNAKAVKEILPVVELATSPSGSEESSVECSSAGEEDPATVPEGTVQAILPAVSPGNGVQHGELLSEVTEDESRTSLATGYSLSDMLAYRDILHGKPAGICSSVDVKAAEEDTVSEGEATVHSNLSAVSAGDGVQQDDLLSEVSEGESRTSPKWRYPLADMLALRDLVRGKPLAIWSTADAKIFNIKKHRSKNSVGSPRKIRSEFNINNFASITGSDVWRRNSEVSCPGATPSLIRAGSAWSDHRNSLKPHGACDEDEAKVAKKMKSILNKLSDANFDSLVKQLMQMKLTTKFQINTLCSEIFEKATTQHGFIELYARLCKYLLQAEVCVVEGTSFRSVLVATCQAHFVKCLLPPEGMLDNKIEDADAFERELKYKNAMLGNIKFVGTLLCQKLVASKVLIGMAYELLETRTAVSIESLCVLLTRCGASFDNDGWMYHTSLQFLFDALKDFAKKDKTIGNRIKFLIQDVLDLRRRKWVA